MRWSWSHQVYGLIRDVDQTQSRLARSQAHLVQSEKWAVVGKLAAGVAHSIRNPLTSVKIRLFSLGRTLSLSSGQKEDLEVISEEIRHIDTILQNFLAFSRPPKPKMQKISPSDVVDLACQLLWHRPTRWVEVKTLDPALSAEAIRVYALRKKSGRELVRFLREKTRRR